MHREISEILQNCPYIEIVQIYFGMKMSVSPANTVDPTFGPSALKQTSKQKPHTKTVSSAVDPSHMSLVAGCFAKSPGRLEHSKAVTLHPTLLGMPEIHSLSTCLTFPVFLLHL